MMCFEEKNILNYYYKLLQTKMEIQKIKIAFPMCFTLLPFLHIQLASPP